MVIKQFQTLEQIKYLTNTRLLFVRALELRLTVRRLKCEGVWGGGVEEGAEGGGRGIFLHVMCVSRTKSKPQGLMTRYKIQMY